MSQSFREFTPAGAPTLPPCPEKDSPAPRSSAGVLGGRSDRVVLDSSDITGGERGKERVGPQIRAVDIDLRSAFWRRWRRTASADKTHRGTRCVPFSTQSREPAGYHVGDRLGWDAIELPTREVASEPIRRRSSNSLRYLGITDPLIRMVSRVSAERSSLKTTPIESPRTRRCVSTGP